MSTLGDWNTRIAQADGRYETLLLLRITRDDSAETAYAVAMQESATRGPDSWTIYPTLAEAGAAFAASADILAR